MFSDEEEVHNEEEQRNEEFMVDAEEEERNQGGNVELDPDMYQELFGTEDEDEEEETSAIRVPPSPAPEAQIFYAKLNSKLAVEPAPFDSSTYDPKQMLFTREVINPRTHETSLAVDHHPVESVLRWRKAGRDAIGNEQRESNARLIRWSDGSYSLALAGDTYFFDSTFSDISAHHVQLFAASDPSTSVFQTQLTRQLKFTPVPRTVELLNNATPEAKAQRDVLCKSAPISGSGAQPRRAKLTAIEPSEESPSSSQQKEKPRSLKSRGKRSLREVSQIEEGDAQGEKAILNAKTTTPKVSLRKRSRRSDGMESPTTTTTIASATRTSTESRAQRHRRRSLRRNFSQTIEHFLEDEDEEREAEDEADSEDQDGDNEDEEDS